MKALDDIHIRGMGFSAYLASRASMELLKLPASRIDGRM